jgi:hypothetical protein
MERRVYEIARKHCRAQAEWSIGLELLQSEVGAPDASRSSRANVRQLEEPERSIPPPPSPTAFRPRPAHRSCWRRGRRLPKPALRIRPLKKARLCAPTRAEEGNHVTEDWRSSTHHRSRHRGDRAGRGRIQIALALAGLINRAADQHQARQCLSRHRRGVAVGRGPAQGLRGAGVECIRADGHRRAVPPLGKAEIVGGTSVSGRY